MKKKYKYILNDNFLKEASEKKLTNIDIEKITGIDRFTVQLYRERANLISHRSFQLKKAKQLRKISLSNTVIGLVVGTVLGDGYLDCRSQTGSVYLTIWHCPQQRKYLLLKYCLLNQLCVSEPRPTVIKNPFLYTSYSLETICHPDLKKLWELIYIKGKKTVTKEVLNLLTVPGFALWYMDDGFKNTNSNHRYGLCTHGFSLEENKLIREHFFKKFQIKTTILVQRNNKLGKKYYYLHFAKDTVSTFEKLVAPFIIPCMKHKMNPEALLKYQGSSETIRETSFWNYFFKDDDMVRTL